MHCEWNFRLRSTYTLAYANAWQLGRWLLQVQLPFTKKKTGVGYGLMTYSIGVPTAKATSAAYCTFWIFLLSFVFSDIFKVFSMRVCRHQWFALAVKMPFCPKSRDSLGTHDYANAGYRRLQQPCFSELYLFSISMAMIVLLVYAAGWYKIRCSIMMHRATDYSWQQLF